MAVELPTSMSLEIVSPARQLVSETGVEEVILPGALGQLGILPGHRPLLTTLTYGEIAYKKGDKWTYFYIEWGFAEVLPDRIIVLAEHAHSIDDFDPEEIKKMKQLAEERIRQKLVDLEEIKQYIDKLQKAEEQLRFIDKVKKTPPSSNEL